MKKTTPRLIGAVLFISLAACTKKEPLTSSPVASLAAQGRTVYVTNCIACHNSNPHLAGAIGPDLYGSSHSLLEARVLRAEYPPNYTPKRQTHAMIALPHLKNEINALEAYLNEGK